MAAARVAPAVARSRTSKGASSSLANRRPVSVGVSGRSNRRLAVSETGGVNDSGSKSTNGSRARTRLHATAPAPGASGDDEFVAPSRKPRQEVVAGAVSVPTDTQTVEDEFRDRAEGLTDSGKKSGKFTSSMKRGGDHLTSTHLEGVKQGWPLAKLLESLPLIPVFEKDEAWEDGSGDHKASSSKPMRSADAVSHLRLYETLVETGRLHNALELLRLLRSAGIQKLGKKVSHKNFLRQCARREAVAVAFEFVSFVNTKDVRLYNMLLSACARAGDARAGFAAFVLMYDAGVAPDCKAYTTLISACGKSGDVEKAFETFRRMELDNVEPSVVTYGALMDSLSRRVLELTNERKRGVTTGGVPTTDDGSSSATATEESLDSSSEISRTLRRCFALREEMDDAGIAPDECVLNSMVSACGRAAVVDSIAPDALRRAFDVFHEMEHSRLTCDAYTYASLITACTNAGDPERALELYQKSGAQKIKRTAAVFAAAAHACGCELLPGGPNLQRALDVWRDMREENVVPDAMLYATLVDVAGRAGERRVAERVTAEMERDGTPPTAAVFAALAGVAAREGDVNGVEVVITDMNQRGIHPVREVFNALITAAARKGDAEAASDAAARARAAGFADDPQTVESLVRSCASSRRADLAWGHYERVTSKTSSDSSPDSSDASESGSVPLTLTRGTYVALVVASGRAGDLKKAFEAADVMRSAGYEPDDTTWRELLSSCARAGDADRAWSTYKQSRESGCPPNDIALNIIIGVTLLKIRELTDPDLKKNRTRQIDADAEGLVDPDTGERMNGFNNNSSNDPEWKEWADRAIAVYHEATVAGVRPRLATFSAMLACLRPPTLPALRAVDSSDAGRDSSAGRLVNAVAREDDAHEDARKYYPLRALILYEEAQALGVVPKFQLGGDDDHPTYDIRGFPPAAAEVAVLTLLRVFRRYADSHAGKREVELPSVTLRVLSDDEMEEMLRTGDKSDQRLARTGDRVVVLLRRLRFNYGGSLERGRIELSGNVITRWLKAKPAPKDSLPGTEPRLAQGALMDQARNIRSRGLDSGDASDFGFGAQPRGAPSGVGRGLGSGASGIDFFGASDDRYSNDSQDEMGPGALSKRGRRNWARSSGSGSQSDDEDCMMSELSRITQSQDSQSQDSQDYNSDPDEEYNK